MRRQIMQQLDAGTARRAQVVIRTCAPGTPDSCSCSMPQFSLCAGDPQPEPVAVEGEAALGVGSGDRGVVDAEKQPLCSCQRGSPLPGGYWISSSGCRSGRGNTRRGCRRHSGSTPAAVAARRRSARPRPAARCHRPGRCRTRRSRDAGTTDRCCATRPERAAADAGTTRSARGRDAGPHSHAGGAIVLPHKAERLVERNGAVELRDRDRDMADRLGRRPAKRQRRGEQQPADKGEDAEADHRAGTPGAEPFEQMVADPQRVGDDRQRRVHRRARGEEAGIDDIEIVDLVRPAVDVERRGLGSMPEADRAVLVSGAGDRQALAEIGVLRQQMSARNRYGSGGARSLRVSLSMRLEIVRPVMQT